jgi:hypothetical protein
LNRLWTALRPETKRINDSNDKYESADSPLISSSWKEIGFQGKDPGTDFRGMGLLGLSQLAYFSKAKTEVARQIMLISNDPNGYFPFAVAGINITSFLLQLLNETRLHRLVFDNLEKLALEDASGFPENPSSDPNIISSSCDVLNEFYCFIFEELASYWKARKARSVFDFPAIFKELQAEFRSNFSTL